MNILENIAEVNIYGLGKNIFRLFNVLVQSLHHKWNET